MTNIEIGSEAELYVLRRYSGRGWICILRNFQFKKLAEIDYAFIKDRRLRIVEVRLANSKYHPYYTINKFKLHKLHLMTRIINKIFPQFNTFKKEVFIEIVTKKNQEYKTDSININNIDLY